MKQIESRLRLVVLAALAVLCLSVPVVQAEPYFDQGVKLYNQRNFKQALPYFQRAVTTRSADSNAFYYLAVTYQQLSDWQRAKLAYRDVYQRFPGSQAAQMAATVLRQLDPAFVRTAGSTAARSAAGAVEATGGYSDSSNLSSAEQAALPAESKVYFSMEDSGHMKVDALLNGKHIPCWFDTGASTCHFGKNHLQAAGVPVPTGPPQGQTSGWAGKPVPIWITTADVQLGNMRRRTKITVEEEMNLPPLIGQTFFGAFDYEIDSKGGYMTLRKKPKAGAEVASNYKDPYAVPFDMVGTKMIVQVEADGRKCPVFIDTGAHKTIFSPGCLSKLGIQVPPDAKRVSMVGVGGGVEGVEFEVDRLRLGPILVEHFPVEGMQTELCCVGQDFLGGWRYTVDNEHNLLKFFH